MAPWTTGLGGPGMTAFRRFAAAAWLAGASLLSVPASSDVLLEVVPDQLTVPQGETLWLDLRISGLTDFFAPALTSFTLNVVFDPAHLAFGGLTFGGSTDQLAPFTPALVSSSPTGSPPPIFLQEIAQDSDDSLNDNQLGEFTLARLKFQAIGVGSSLVGVVYGPQDLQFTGDVGSIFDRTATVTVTEAVPEPATVLSLMAGLTALLLVGWRRTLRAR